MHANTHITKNFFSLAIENFRLNKCNICKGGESSYACHNTEEVRWAPQPVQMPCQCKKSMPKKKTSSVYDCTVEDVENA